MKNLVYTIYNTKDIGTLSLLFSVFVSLIKRYVIPFCDQFQNKKCSHFQGATSTLDEEGQVKAVSVLVGGLTNGKRHMSIGTMQKHILSSSEVNNIEANDVLFL